MFFVFVFVEGQDKYLYSVVQDGVEMASGLTEWGALALHCAVESDKQMKVERGMSAM